MMQYTLKKSQELINEKNQSILECQLSIFDHLKVIQLKEIWKNKEYYNDENSFNRFKDLSFIDFIGSTFGIPVFQFINMDRIVTMKGIDGRKLLLERGLTDATTCVNLSEEKRQPCLEYVRKNPGKTMRMAENDLYPEKKTKKEKIKKEIVKTSDKNLQNECKKLQKENTELKKENQDLREKVAHLEKSILLLASGESLKKENQL